MSSALVLWSHNNKCLYGRRRAGKICLHLDDQEETGGNGSDMIYIVSVQVTADRVHGRCIVHESTHDMLEGPNAMQSSTY